MKRFQRTSPTHQGFSLIQVMISMVILAVLIAGVMKNMRKNVAALQEQGLAEQGERAINEVQKRLLEDIENAADINPPCGLSYQEAFFAKGSPSTAISMPSCSAYPVPGPLIPLYGARKENLDTDLDVSNTSANISPYTRLSQIESASVTADGLRIVQYDLDQGAKSCKVDYVPAGGGSGPYLNANLQEQVGCQELFHPATNPDALKNALAKPENRLFILIQELPNNKRIRYFSTLVHLEDEAFLPSGSSSPITAKLNLLTHSKFQKNLNPIVDFKPEYPLRIVPARIVEWALDQNGALYRRDYSHPIGLAGIPNSDANHRWSTTHLGTTKATGNGLPLAKKLSHFQFAIPREQTLRNPAGGTNAELPLCAYPSGVTPPLPLDFARTFPGCASTPDILARILKRDQMIQTVVSPSLGEILPPVPDRGFNGLQVRIAMMSNKQILETDRHQGDNAPGNKSPLTPGGIGSDHLLHFFSQFSGFVRNLDARLGG